MISDKGIRQQFQNYLDSPDVVTSILRKKDRNQAGYRLDNNLSLQICKGLSFQQWKDAPVGGCVRHIAVFTEFGVVPKYCFDCYKVAIEPRTVLELFKLLLIYDRITLPNNNTRKCMIEDRPYCNGTYKGFIYCRGLDDAKEVCRIVREAVSDDISSDVPVTLKHGCSEYAQVYPEYAEIDPDKKPMKYQSDWQFYENFADESFVFTTPDEKSTNEQENYSFQDIFSMQYWLRYAASNGDNTYLILTGGKKLEPIPR